MALVETFTDDFPGTSLDSTKWPTVVDPAFVSVASNALSIQSGAVGTGDYHWVKSQSTWTFTGSSAFVRVVAPVGIASSETSFFVALDDHNRIGFMVANTTLYVSYQIGGSETRTVVGGFGGYDPVAHGWFRVRESGGVVYPAYSPDGANWTELSGVSIPWDTSATFVQLMVGKWDTGDAQATGSFQHVNLIPHQRLFTTQTPSGTDNSDGSPGITVGTSWFSIGDGQVEAIYFYAPVTVSGTWTVALWTVDSADPNGSGGTLLASKTLTSAPTGGTWNRVQLDTPVRITATTMYRAGVFSGDGRYVNTPAFFASELVNGDLHAPGAGGSYMGGVLNQGTFTINASLSYPTSSFNANSYFVDVDFFPGPPSATPVTGADTAAGTDAATGLTATLANPETAGGIDAASGLTAAQGGSETAGSAELAGLVAALTGADASGSSDASALVVDQGGMDTVSGADSMAALTAAQTSADSAGTTEVGSVPHARAWSALSASQGVEQAIEVDAGAYSGQIEGS